jgi:hypothetical protein
VKVSHGEVQLLIVKHDEQRKQGITSRNNVKDVVNKDTFNK